MSDVLQAVLTAAANVAGYGLAFWVVVHAVRRSGQSWAVGFPAAATALFFLWVITLAFYVGTEFYMDAHWQNPHNVPPTVEATNGIAENIQSEVIQIWLAALCFKYLRWPGSPESQ